MTEFSFDMVCAPIKLFLTNNEKVQKKKSGTTRLFKKNLVDQD